MPKYFYILYFYFAKESVFDYVVDTAKEVFKGLTLSCSSLNNNYACLRATSDRPILPWEIENLELVFGDPFVGKVIFSHNNATSYDDRVASMEEVGLQHVYSAGGLLKFSLWEILTLKRFFFVRNVHKLVLNYSDIAGFYYHNEFLCFFLQSSKPIIPTEIRFLTQTVSPRIPHLFKTFI